MDIEKDINLLYRFIQYNLLDNEFQKALELTDLEEVGTHLIETDDMELIQKYIAILNFIENETDIATPVSDDLYDTIVERYKDLGGDNEIGTTIDMTNDDSKTFREHKYPELRGSLSKVHFLRKKDIPEKDSRKSLEQFLLSADKELSTIKCPITVAVDLKFDGVSHVFEMSKGDDYPTVKHVLTRYDVGRNLGMDVSHIFKNSSINGDIRELLLSQLPYNINQSESFGLKVETLMTTPSFQKFMKDTGDSKCNRRSAITSIVNQTPEQFDPSLVNYLSIQPLQIASVNYIDAGSNGWFYIGKMCGHHQYVHISTTNLMFTCENLYHLAAHMDSYAIQDAIQNVKTFAGDIIPIDGVVFTLMNQEVAQILGRAKDKNKFQIAFKFPQGVKKTTLREVQFPVGPAASTITPLAIVEPVVINGNTITNATLSNFDKMDRLDLNIGDEVIIRYDIIPKLEKDSSCKKGKGVKVVRPESCPICHSDLHGGNRCLNPNCDGKLSGKIYNYLRKMKIKSIGKKTIDKFVSLGYLKCIGDLYRLGHHKAEIESMIGFGPKAFNNILTAIFLRTSVYPHELLGALGIPAVSTETMKKACTGTGLVYAGSKEEVFACQPALMNIHGIGEVTAKAIVQGIADRLNDIEDILRYITLLEYKEEETQPSAFVLFTEFRNQNFAEYLEDNNVRVLKSYTKSITHLFVPDGTNVETSKNAKITKARENGVMILTESEAKKKFNYNK